MKKLETAVVALIEGDLNGFSTVRTATHPDLLEATAMLPQLSISRLALARVLNAWRSGACTADDVQQWASFARRGYVAGQANGGLHSIDIAYDPRDEELIAEIIGRLDEIGDVIDGEIDSEEREAMLMSLET